MPPPKESPFIQLDPLAGLLGSVAPDSIVSRTLLATPQLRVVLFGFAPGQELTEHKTPMAATIQILAGHGSVVLGEEERAVEPGSLIYMTPDLPHSVRAEGELILLLTMVKSSA